MRVGIIQSNYVPWKGYFDIIASVDAFFFHDDVQFTKGDWRNRNKIKTPTGSQWLTVPCGTNQKRLVCEVEMVDSSWQLAHWRRIEASYGKAPHFQEYGPFFKDFYLGQNWQNLSDMNQHFVKRVAKDLLSLKTEFRDSRELDLTMSKGDRVLELLRKAGATEYVSGPAAKSYLDEKAFGSQNIQLEWFDYSNYPEYQQLHPPFDHAVSILDLFFNLGPEAPSFMLQ